MVKCCGLIQVITGILIWLFNRVENLLLKVKTDQEVRGIHSFCCKIWLIKLLETHFALSQLARRSREPSSAAFGEDVNRRGLKSTQAQSCYSVSKTKQAQAEENKPWGRPGWAVAVTQQKSNTYCNQQGSALTGFVLTTRRSNSNMSRTSIIIIITESSPGASPTCWNLSNSRWDSDLPPVFGWLFFSSLPIRNPQRQSSSQMLLLLFWISFL